MILIEINKQSKTISRYRSSSPQALPLSLTVTHTRNVSTSLSLIHSHPHSLTAVEQNATDTHIYQFQNKNILSNYLSLFLAQYRGIQSIKQKTKKKLVQIMQPFSSDEANIKKKRKKIDNT